MEKIACEIQKGAELKKCETKDSSAPVIDPEAKVKMVDRSALIDGVAHPPELKKCETKDSSAPVIPADAKLKESEHAKMCQDIAAAAANKK